MRISGLQKLSLLDYPEKTAATVFTGGCNLRCPFCHNAGLVTRALDFPEITQEEFFAFLEKRRGKLDGVCITGGEPLLQSGLEGFIRRIRDMGFLVKLDTNGAYPEKLRRLIDASLLNYVAMDVKNIPEKYALTVGLPAFDTAPVIESIALLKEGRVPYEFRTTLVKGLHDAQDIPVLGELLTGADRYFLQNFKDSGDLIGFCAAETPLEMDAFSPGELEAFAEILRRDIGQVSVRG